MRYGCHIQAWYGHTRVTLAPMVQDGGDDHKWFFYGNEATPLAHYPISTKNLIVIGTKSGVSRVLVNYTIEPITGYIIIPASFPVFDSITASYYYYTNLGTILTQSFMPNYNDHPSEMEIGGQPVYTIFKNFPGSLEFKMVLSQESDRHVLIETLEEAYYVLVLDNQVDTNYGLRAYEGPIQSNEVGAFQKGASYLLPIKVEVCQAGSIDATTGLVTWR